MERLFDSSGQEFAPDDLYQQLNFPAPPEDRPYLFINMVSSTDGKIVMDNNAAGLGSPVDQSLMGRIRENAEAVIIGSSTLRAEKHVHFPDHLLRAVVTKSGDLPMKSDFFAQTPSRAHVFAPHGLDEQKRKAICEVADMHLVGEEEVDVKKAVEILRQKFNITRLLGEGGAVFNASLFQAGIVDELFLTFAPKIRGGADIHTIVEGDPLPKDRIVQLLLVSLYKNESELFLRYRVVKGL